MKRPACSASAAGPANCAAYRSAVFPEPNATVTVSLRAPASSRTEPETLPSAARSTTSRIRSDAPSCTTVFRTTEAPSESRKSSSAAESFPATTSTRQLPRPPNDRQSGSAACNPSGICTVTPAASPALPAPASMPEGRTPNGRVQMPSLTSTAAPPQIPVNSDAFLMPAVIYIGLSTSRTPRAPASGRAPCRPTG